MGSLRSLALERLVASSLPRIPPMPAQPAFTISDEHGGRVVLPFAPLPTSHSGFGWDWDVVDRAGRKALLLRSTKRQGGLSFALNIGYPDLQESVDPLLSGLERVADSGDRITISYSRPERGLWRLTDLTYDVTARQAGTNAPTRASAALTFIRYGDPPASIGPARPSAATSALPALPRSSPAGRSYTVRGGETLWTIALRLYGNGDLWQQLADHNGIGPRDLAAGMVLRLP